VTRENRERLHDILEAIDAIRGHATVADDASPDLVRDAILYRLVVIGEAVKALPDEVRSGAPEINWRGIAGLRDLLTHEYFRIERVRIDEVVERELDPLDEAVAQLLAGLGDE
jgi:uncharacterized protein with HEPN domain